MDILQRKSQKILGVFSTNCLILLALVGVFSSCGSQESQDASELAGDTEARGSSDSSATLIPETLVSFDKFYVGTLDDKVLQMNLRRYGSQLSGSFWFKNEPREGFFQGELQADESYFNLEVFDKKKNKIGALTGYFGEEDAITGEWNDQISQGTQSLAIKPVVDINDNRKPLTVNFVEGKEESTQGNRVLELSYPQLKLEGIVDGAIAQRVNTILEEYFASHTLKDSLDIAEYDFEESVRYDLADMTGQFVSFTKHHHLSKNNGTALFDDSHGISINYLRGKVYELQDLFKPNAFEQLNQIVTERINKACGGGLNKKALAACELMPEENSSFSLSPDKITFHLTERLPHKFRGCGYVRIQYADLESLLNPSGPLFKKINPEQIKPVAKSSL